MRSARRSSRRRGFTLIEVLVVVVVIGIMAIIGLGELSKISRREALSAMSIQISSTFQLVPITLRKNDAIMFIKLGPMFDGVSLGQAGRKFRNLQLVVDTCCDAAGLSGVGKGNGIFNDPASGGGDTVLQTLPVSMDDFALSVAKDLPAVTPFAVNDVLPSGKPTVWGTRTTCATCGMEDDSYVIGLNFRGQAIGPDGNNIPAARLGLTRADMVGSSAALSPLIDFEMKVNPIWEVSVQRTVEGKRY